MPENYFPPVSELVDVSAIPGDFEQLESLAQDGVNLLLGKIRYKNYATETSSSGESSVFYVVIVSKALRLPVFSTGINIVFFRGSDVNYSEFPLMFEMRWPIRKYFRNFRVQGFSYTPEAFIDILLQFSSFGQRNFFAEIVATFLSDGDNAYQALITNLKSNVVTYSNGSGAVALLLQDINDQLDLIKDEADGLLNSSDFYNTEDLFSEYENNAVFSAAVTSINASIDSLKSDHDVNINIWREVIAAALGNFSSVGDKIDRLINLFKKWLADISMDEVKALLIPQFRVELKAIPMSLELPRNILIPLIETSPGVWVEDNTMVGSPPELIKAAVNFTTGPLAYDTETGFEISVDENLTIDLPRCKLAGTRIELEFHGIKLDLSRKKNIPEATADGRPEDFIGVYVTEGIVSLPVEWGQNPAGSTGELFVNNLLVGTGGLSGKIGMRGNIIVPSPGPGIPPVREPNPLVKVSFGGFEAGLIGFDITFQQNAIKESNIYGRLKIPGLKDGSGADAEIDIVVHIFDDGDFKVTASEPQGIEFVFKPGGTEIFRFYVKTLFVEKNDGIWSLGLSGEIDITAAVPGGLASQFLPEKVTIEKLVIYSNGKFEFVGGVNLLPKALTMKLGPVELQISNLSLGAHEQNSRRYLFFGFDGGLNVDPGGVDVRGKGIQFFFTNDGGSFDAFLRIARIDVSLIIPGTADKAQAIAIIEGYLAMRETGTAGNIGGPEYRGGVSLTLPKAGIKGSATMAYAPSVPSFAIDIELSLPAPIPLGPTGLGIYGFRGLLGSRYVATLNAVGLPDDANWWEYYKAPPQAGVVIDKMEQKPGFSLGAGVSLATASDSGRAFSSKLFFMLSLPDVVLLQGQAAMLSERIDLATPDDPPFSAFLAFSSQSITGGFGVNIGLPKSNPEILKVNGAIELGFFFQNASAWYVNVGRDLPESKRIQGRILDIFNVYAYLMLSGSGIKAGAGASYKFDKTFLGVVHVHLEAQIDVGGFVNFRPQQIGGFVFIGGALDISVFGIGFYFGASAYLGAEAPKPFLIIGKIHVEFRVKLLFIKKTFEFDIELKWERSTAKHTTPLALMGDGGIAEYAPAGAGKSVSAKAINVATLESYDIYYVGNALPSSPSAWAGNPQYTIPMDSWLDLKFARSVQPDLNDIILKRITTLAIAAKHVEMYPPQAGPSAQVQHDFRLDSVRIKYFDGAWQDYDLFQALPTSDFIASLPTTGTPVVTANDLLVGSWQASEVPGSYTNLRLLAANPFSFLNQTSGNPETTLIENFGYSASMLFCNGELLEGDCQDWNAINVNQSYTPGNWFFDRDLWIMMEVPGAVVPQSLIVQDRPDQPLPGITHALAGTQTSQLNDPVVINVKFPEPVVEYSITYLVEPCNGTNDGRSVLNFKGGKEVLEIPSHAAYQFSGAFTWVLWVDPETISNPLEPVEANFRGALSKGFPTASGNPAPAAGGYGLRIAKLDTGGPMLELWVELTLVDPQQNSHKQVITGRWFVEDWWYLVSFTKNGPLSADVELLVNGQPPQQRTDSDPVVAIANVSTNAPVFIGNQLGYVGNVDAARVYNYALTRQQVEAQYYLTRCEDVIQPADYTGFWQLNETQGIVAPDMSGNANHGRLMNYTAARTAVNGGAWPELPCEKVESGQSTVLSFDNPFERLALPTVAPVSYAGDFTIESWMKVPVDPAFNPNNSWYAPGVFKLANYSAYERFEVRVTKGPASAGLCETHVIIQTHDFTYDWRFHVPDDWMYVVIRSTGLDPADWNVRINDQVPFLVNGIGGPLVQPLITTAPLLVGASYGDFIGQIDFIRIYNRALTNTEIHDAWLAGRCHPLEITAGLAGCWMLDEVQGDLAPEKSGNAALMGRLVGYGPARILPGGGAWQDAECENECLFTVTYTSQDESTRTEASVPVLGGSNTWRRVSLLKVCWTTFTTYSYNLMQSAVNDNRDLQLASLAYQMQNVLQPVWRPNTDYAVVINGRDVVDATNNQQTYVFGFHTKGPVGHFLQYRPLPESDTAQTDKYKLSSLKPYVDYQRSYPNADGNIINAKPLYYKQGENNLLLFFTFPAAYNMFRDWPIYGGLPLVNSEINISIIEAVDQSSPTIMQNWIPDDHTSESLDVQILHNIADNSMVAGANCDGFGFDYVHNRHLSITPPDLKPLKLYIAIFNGKLDADVKEVHRYAFQTSRYGSFPEHIESYDLGSGHSALRTVPFTPLDLVKAAQILGNSLATTDPLVQEYMHPFDRLLRGALGIDALDAPMTTEITILTNAAGTITHGVLLRSPEPFNDPKLPEAIQQDGILATYTPAAILLKLFSKDGSQVFISNANLQLVTGTLTLTFRQKQFDGNNFVNNTSHPFPVINLPIA